MPGASSRTLGGFSKTGKPKISHVDNNNLQNFQKIDSGDKIPVKMKTKKKLECLQ